MRILAIQLKKCSTKKELFKFDVFGIFGILEPYAIKIQPIIWRKSTFVL